MSLLAYITQPRKALAIVQPSEHIFFISHMRAYSSLFGHIMGSHPKVSGYYELHIGYHSWKSLIRQKTVFFQEEDPKPGNRYMFDKVLHNDHFVSPSLLNTERAKVIFSLRDPEKTIPSIMKLYAKEDPSHDFNDPTFATRYYIDRARELVALSKQMQKEYFYFDAEVVTKQTDLCLSQLTGWLDLDPPLEPSYTVQRKTSVSRYGDTSDALKSGKIERSKDESEPVVLNPELLAEANDVYLWSRDALKQGTSALCLDSAKSVV